MPRPINEADILAQTLDGYPVTVNQRLEQWQRTEALHQLKWSEPLATPPGHLENIAQRPHTNDPGLLVAADRLRILYEAGMPVLSDSRLLFGERLLKEELDKWDQFVHSGQAVLLTDYWYSQIRPNYTLPILDDEEDYPTPEDWNTFLADVAGKLLKVTAQGSVVVFVHTVSDLMPSWDSLASCPR